MREWLSHSTDKLILLLLFIGVWTSTMFVAIHIFHHDSDSMQAIAFIAFMTGSVSTVLGALILILTGRTSPPMPSSTTSISNGNSQPQPSPSPDLSGKLKVNVP